MDTKEFKLPEVLDPLRSRYKQINFDYLVLARDVCRMDAAAAITLGIPNDVVPIIAALPTARIMEISDRGVLLTIPRIKKYGDWNDIAGERFDGNHLMRLLLTEA